MRYRCLLNLRITHSFYTDKRCADFALTPDAATLRIIAGQRCVLKTVPDGIRIFIALDEQNEPLIPLPGNLTFGFQMRLHNPDFALFTDLSRFPVPLQFTNALLPGAGPIVLAPVERALSGGKRSNSTEMFAVIDLRYHGSVETPVDYEIAFEAKQAYWRYYVIGARNSTPYSIADTATNPTGFSQMTHLNTNPDTADQIALRLMSRFSDKQWYRFVSDLPISCQQSGSSLQLMQNSTAVMKHLPVPPLTNMMLIKNDSGQSEVTLYQIIQHFAQ